MRTQQWLFVVTTVLIILFAYTGISKVIDFKTYSHQMYNQPLPRWITSILIWAVPVAEFVVTILLLFGVSRYIGLVLSFLLLFTFTLYVALILSDTFSYVPCSCAGIFSSMGWTTHLFVNLVLTALAGIGLISEARLQRIGRH